MNFLHMGSIDAVSLLFMWLCFNPVVHNFGVIVLSCSTVSYWSFALFQVFLSGYSTTTDLSNALFNLGYCPQADTLWELVTLKQHLKCFALIKGVARDRVDNLVEQ